MLKAADSAEPPREALLAALVDVCIEALAQAPVWFRLRVYKCHIFYVGEIHVHSFGQVACEDI